MMLVYVTFKDKKEAEKIIGALLDKRLIACATVLPVTSHFTWKGKREKTKETVAFMKAQEKHWNKVQTAIAKMHSYETPCIIRLPAQANSAFARWVRKETR